MHIFFSGIGGTAIGPLALIAYQAGFTVSGSDKQPSQYIEYLRSRGIENISIGQTGENIEKTHAAQAIDWLVYSSAVAIENPDHPELVFAQKNQIRTSKRDELLNKIIDDTDKKLVAIAGTHGKTTTTAMAIWLFQKTGMPISYSVGAKIPFGDMGHFDAESKFFAYECDEFDRNFLAFHPYMSLITGIDYDHQEIFPTRQDYVEAFKQFLGQSDKNLIWQSDIDDNKITLAENYTVLKDNDSAMLDIHLTGEVNRRNAWQVIQAVHLLTGKPIDDLIDAMNQFPGLSRRFEKIIDGLYTDYAHTIPKIAGALQTAQEVSSDIVVIYEPLTNRRQYFIEDEYKDLFKKVKKLYWVPSYLAREDTQQKILTPAELIQKMNNPDVAIASELNPVLKESINAHLRSGDLVLALSGGGGGSLDEWLRREFKS